MHSVEGNNEAEVAYNHGGRMATFYLTEESDVKPTDRGLEQSAFHEVCHLLLAELAYKAREKFAQDEVEEDIHAVIRVLENVIINKMR